jgi:hypothetical protein
MHGDLINLAMVLASDRWLELYERLDRTLSCEALFQHAKRVVPAELTSVPLRPEAVSGFHVDRAYWYFIVAWVGRNGVAGTRRINYQIAVRWTHGGGHGGQRLESAVGSFPAFHDRLKRVLILNRNAFDLLPHIDDAKETAIYVDPPYLIHTRGAGRSGPTGGGSNYLYDFADGEHERLAEQLRRFETARVVVSYYDDPALDELYPGWTKRLVYRQKNLHVQNRRGSSKSLAPEVLLINGPSVAQDETLFGEGRR